MIRVAINGACGRMGKIIASLIEEDQELRLTGAIESSEHPNCGKPYAENVIVTDSLKDIECDIVVDFSAPAGTELITRECYSRGLPIVIGTTGLSETFFENVNKEYSKKIPILISPNMSVGVNLLFKIAGDIARSLGEGYDIEIVEKHHRFKKDAPSGTALKIAKEIVKVMDGNTSFIFGREGLTGERPKNVIGIHSVRAGDIIGEHTIIYSTLGETIEITHKAHSRECFARGVIRAVKYLVNADPGLYSMDNVIR